MRSTLRAILSILVIQISCLVYCESQSSMSGGLPGDAISSSSAAGVSLSNGRRRLLTLDSTNQKLVYALFPYIPFNTSDPGMGSFHTLFRFRRRINPSATSANYTGALGFIAIDPATPGSNAAKKNLEDRLLAITNREYLASNGTRDINTTQVINSNYAAVVFSIVKNVSYNTVSIGAAEPVASFDTIIPGEYDSTEFQYIKPGSISKTCLNKSLDLQDLLCPSTYATFKINDKSSGFDASFGVQGLFPNSTYISAPRLVGFFAFDGGVFDVNLWQFTNLDIVEGAVVGESVTILNASSSSPSMPSVSMLTLMLIILSFFYF